MKKKFALICAILAFGFLCQTAVLAVPAVTIRTDKAAVQTGETIAVSGTAASDMWISIKGLDSSGNIVYFNAVLSDATGKFSGSFAVPAMADGTFTLVAGYGSITASTTVTIYTPTPPPTPPPAPTVTTTTSGTGADAVTTAGTTLTGTTTGGTTTAAVPDATMTALISDAASSASSGGSSVIAITVPADSGATGAALTIPGSSFHTMANGTDAALQVTTGVGSVTFDSTAVDGISGASSGDVCIGMSTVSTTSLPADAQNAVGDRPVYNFSVTSNGQTISSFGGGSATVTLPYALRPNENPNAVVVYYIDASGKLQAMQGHYNAATGTVTFLTSHFSDYMIGYNKVVFSDVAAAAWYADAVTFIAARGITAGTSQGVFSPNMQLTRGQFIVLLLRAYGIAPIANPSGNFADAGSTYYTGYLAAAKQLGISQGIGNNMYAPEKDITRQEMFTLLYNALKTVGQLPQGTKQPDGSSGKTLSDFSDAGQIDAWAKDAMTLLVKTGTVGGSAGKLNPLGVTTRAEMAQVLYNLLSK